MFAEYKPNSLKLKNKTLSLEKPVVMGILNTTRDSFFDGGKYHTTETALLRCEEMLKQGASIIDIGGQSSRPGAEIISTDEELNQTVPFVEAICRRFPEAVLSVDTFRAEVARKCVEAGAGIVNDISAGDDDPAMLKTVADLGVPYIAMHKKGIPETMQLNPQYSNVAEEVYQYLGHKAGQCKLLGIRNLVLDPGFGFGKTMEHNYRLLKRLDLLHRLNCPVLVGVSRKSMVWKLLESKPEQALNGTTAVHMLALMKGAHILRVHDVREAVECIRIADYINSL